MPDLKDKKELAAAAKALATGYDLVQRGAATYIPVDYQTLSPTPPPQPNDRIWIPLSRSDKQSMAKDLHNILFANDGEFRSFDYMVQQLALSSGGVIDSILIKTPSGIMALNNKGKLVPHDGTFTPNFVNPTLNDDPSDKEAVFNTLVEWLGSEDDAHSLLSHLATCLAPGWAAVKYVLLIGEGRNGKGVLLSMLDALFGVENVSNITRQMMAERSPAVIEVNDKLLNIVFDGEMNYLKDSSLEKTILAGEPAQLRMLYESGTTRVQTNALFIEAVNTEPKARDKSPALQKRLARFHFNKVYALDMAFRDHMLSENMLGALLSLLIDHYVRKEEVATALKLTKASMEMQLDQVWMSSPILQFLDTLDPQEIDEIRAGKMMVDTFLASFKPWADSQGMNERSMGDLLSLMKQNFEIGWKSVRVHGRSTQQRKIVGLRPETELALIQTQGVQDGIQAESADEELVGDGEVHEGGTAAGV